MKRKTAIAMLAVVSVLLLYLCGHSDDIRWTSDEAGLRASCEGREFVFDLSWERESAEPVVRSVSGFLQVFDLAEERAVQVCGKDAEAPAEGLTLRLDAGEAPVLTDYWQLYQSINEDIPDYGVAYAAVAAVCEARELCPVEAGHTDAELAQWLCEDERMYMLDLTLPLLEEHFVDAENAALARETAAAIGRFALRERGEEELLRLTETDDAEKTQLKNDWLRSAGASGTYEPLALLQYEYGEYSEDYPYLLRCGDAVWYFAAEDVREEGYDEFIRQFLRLEALRPLDFADAREALRGYIEEDIPPVDIYTSFVEPPEDDFVSGYYLRTENCIKIYDDWESVSWALLHEYIHYLREAHSLLHDNLYTNALDVEAVTEAIATFECENRMASSIFVDEDGIFQQPEAFEFFSSTSLWDEENLRMDFPTLYTLISLLCYFDYNADLFYPYRSIGQTIINDSSERNGAMVNLSYQEGAVFVWYMFEKYGRDEVLSCSHHQVTGLWALWDKPFAEEYEEFGKWLYNTTGAWFMEQAEINGWWLTE
ncbi:MAG: hypothetical protein IJU78_06015 [Clostridia bacterium]|nr:hypothetical protein [Clostridia bacterium]